MTMPVAPHLVPLAGFAGLMATAAFEDFRRLVIPNGLTLGLCILWPGPGGTLPLLVLTGLLGGLLCLLLLTPAGKLIATARPTLGDPSGGDPGRGAKRLVVPYGVAIAAAALIVTIPPNFN